MASITAGSSGDQRLSFLQRPDTAEAFHDFVKLATMNGTAEIYYYSEKIMPLDEKVVMRLNNYRLDLSKLAVENEAGAKAVDDYLSRYTGDIEHIRLVPLQCRFRSAIAIYDTHELKIIDWLELNRKVSIRAQAQDEPLRFKSQQNVDDEDESLLIQYQAFPGDSATGAD